MTTPSYHSAPESHPLVAHRPPRYAPQTDADRTVAQVADWLDKEGYTPASIVLHAMTRRNEIVTVKELWTVPGLLDQLAARQCRIFSNKRNAWWRPEGKGYTNLRLEAGVFTVKKAADWADDTNDVEILGDSTLDNAGIDGLS